MNDINRLRASWVRKIEITHVDGVTVQGPCWLWRGAIDKVSGYGRVQVGTRGAYRCAYLHRVTYEIFTGPIPDGLHADHLCRVRACCNPDHLEAVTPMTNARRGLRGSQTECKNGHPLSGDNLYVNQESKTQYVHRVCRTCRAEYLAEWRAKLKQRKADTWSKYLADETRNVA